MKDQWVGLVNTNKMVTGEDDRVHGGAFCGDCIYVTTDCERLHV